MPFIPPVTDSVSFDTLLSHTLNSTRNQRYDAIFRNSAFWAWMHMNGRKELYDGGVKIQRDVEYAKNGTVGSYEGLTA